MTVRDAVVKPGGSTTFTFPYAMGPGMGGSHHFQVLIPTNDPQRSELVFDVHANSVETPTEGTSGS